MMETATLRPRNRLAVWLAVIAGLALLGAANWHLVHVAMTSQPDCVSHLRLGQGDAARGVYSAAKSSCSP
jgi:hypothetical protein